MNRRVLAMVLTGLIAYLLLPWYAMEEGFFSVDWLPYYPADPEAGPAPWQVSMFDRPWLLGVAVPLLVPLSVLRSEGRGYARVMLGCGVFGTIYSLAQGVAIGPFGWEFQALTRWFGPLQTRQFGMGAGALLVHLVFIFMITEGLAAFGAVRGDRFIAGAIGLQVALVGAFVFYPSGLIFLRAFETPQGSLSFGVFVENLLSEKLWTIGSLWGGWGVAWNSLSLALLAGLGSTLLGLCFALLVTRSATPLKRALRSLTVLPIITPPFVLGLALILTFGRAGAVTTALSSFFGVGASRYIFGLPGVLLAQLLSFTPIAFLVLIGVVEGVSPSMEEAAQTLRADPKTTFRTVTLPLIRPGLANAFLLGFIESLADFGNPLVLGGDFDVLSTEIYFAVAGAQADFARAAALAIVLLSFTLAAFFLQRRWVKKAQYTSMTGKADHGEPTPLPRGLEIAAKLLAYPWTLFTVAMYLVIVLGGFVELWGRDHSFTLRHFKEMFDVTPSARVFFSGAAWDSLGTTVMIASVSAPLTAALGLTAAYLLERQRFAFHSAFEFGTMLSFAIPGTVIGVSYILAFNVPPIELTGTGAILVVCFVFRNMPVGIRAGLAALSQVDRSLDEASLMLGANTFQTTRRVTLPLLRPALIAALIYGFVRAMTAVSAVIFLVSADYELSTTYILGRVENGDYGPAVAYSSVLVVLMMAAIVLIQRVVGQREIGRGSL